MKQVISVLLILILSECKNSNVKSIEYILSKNDKKYWRIYFYNKHKRLITYNYGVCFYKGGKTKSYYYKDEDTMYAERYELTNISDLSESWKIMNDTILVIGGISYMKILSASDTQVVYKYLDVSNDNIYLLKKEGNQQSIPISNEEKKGDTLNYNM